MICKQCLPLLDLYLDGELDGRTAELVNSHLSACPSCAGAYSKLRREQDLYLSYECDVHTAPSFWDDVMARVSEEKTARSTATSAGMCHRLSVLFGMFNAPRLSLTTASLLVFAAIGLTVGVLRFTGDIQETPDHAPVSRSADASVPSLSAPPIITGEKSASAESGTADTQAEGKGSNPHHPGGGRDRLERRSGVMLATHGETDRRSNRKPEVRSASTTDELVREAEQKYVAAIRLLSLDVNRRRSRLDPETAAQFKQTLAAIDQTIGGTRRAVREHPGDPVAVQYMLAAYSKKVEVLREMVSYRSDNE